MKTLRDMKTRFDGKLRPYLLFALLVVVVISFVPLVIHRHQELMEKAENEIVITKDRWHCFAGVLDDNSNFECMIYRRKDTDFGKHSHPRRGDHNKEQRTSVYPFQ